MTPREKCVSFETARKMREAGFAQEAAYFWEMDHEGVPFLNARRHDQTLEKQFGDFWKDNQFFAAYDTQEVGDMLPNAVDGYGLSTHKCNPNGSYQRTEKPLWYVQYRNNTGCLNYTQNVSEAEARADMALWLEEFMGSL